MNLFYKRPLALILCIMISGFSLFLNVSLEIRISICIISLALIGLIFIFKDNFRGRNVICTCSCIALSVSIFLGILFTSLFYPTEYYGKNLYIEGVVLSSDHTDTSTSSLVLKTTIIGDNDANYTLLVSGEKEQLSGIVEGHLISLYGKIEDFSSSLGFDSKAYYSSKGCSAIITDANTVSILGFNEKNVLEGAVDGIRGFISSRLHLCTNHETGPFLSALLTGERSNLSKNTALNFIRLGISHVLALSGMHLVILTAFISKLLGIFRVGKKPRLLICALFTLFYMAMVGFTPSVTRSGLMLLIYTLLFLTSYTKDSVTSLAISVAVIIAFSPTSAFDISLWLSASATLGVILFAEMFDNIKKDDKIIIKIGKVILQSILCSVFAIAMSSVFTLLYFDQTSVFSVFATIIFSFLCEVLIHISILVIIFGSFIPLFGQLAILVSDITHALAELFSNIPWAAASTDFVIVRVLTILLIATIVVFLLLDLKKYKKFFYIALSSLLLLLYISCTILGNKAKSGEQFTYSCESDSMIIRSEGEITVICASYGSEYDVIDRLYEDRIVYVNKLIYPVYFSSMYANAESLISTYKTDSLYLPNPTNYEERALAEQMANLLSSYGTSLSFYYQDEVIDIGNIKYISFYRTAFQYEKTQLFAYTLKDGDIYHSFFSKGAFKGDTTAKRALILKSQSIIIGSKGVYSTYIDTLAPSATRIIVGHPYKMNDEVKMYYEEKGASIYYTDAPVTIKFKD